MTARGFFSQIAKKRNESDATATRIIGLESVDYTLGLRSLSRGGRGCARRTKTMSEKVLAAAAFHVVLDPTLLSLRRMPVLEGYPIYLGDGERVFPAILPEFRRFKNRDRRLRPC
jgi:hypothetical protein